jgi:hypothetical protein
MNFARISPIPTTMAAIADKADKTPVIHENIVAAFA